MDASLFLAKLIGPTLVAVSASILLNQSTMREMASDFLAHRALIYLAGIMTFVTGLAVVLVHNVWVAGWPVIITILGWLCVMSGAFRIIFPDSVKSLGEAMLAKGGALTVTGI